MEQNFKLDSIVFSNDPYEMNWLRPIMNLRNCYARIPQAVWVSGFRRRINMKTAGSV